MGYSEGRFTESVWYESKDLTGTYRQILDGDYFKNCDSVSEMKEALNRHAKEFHTEGTTYIICKVTYRKYLDEEGRFERLEEITEAVEEYTVPKEEVA